MIPCIINNNIERKQFEELLQTSEARFRKVIEKNADAMIILDQKKIVRFANSSAEILFRQKKEKLLGKEFSYPLTAGEITEIEIFYKPGVTIVAEMRVVDLDWEGEKAYLASLRDITERKMSERMLRMSENRLAMAVEASGAGIYDHFIPLELGNYRSVRWANILGYEVEEFPPSSQFLQWFYNKVHPDDRLRLEKVYSDLVDDRITTYNIEIQIKHKSGKWVHVQILAKAVDHDDKGRAKRIVGVMLDITERKKAEQHIKDSLREKEILLKEIHHRVKNNMQVICSLINLQSDYFRNPNDRMLMRESQDRIHAMAMVHNKLYQSGDFENIDFGDYIKSLMIHLFGVYKVNSNRIKYEIKAENVFLDINLAIPCGLLVNELLTNVLKHAFPSWWEGKGIITVLLHQRKSQSYELIIQDNGIGIPKNFNILKARSLGLHLVTLLVKEQLNGRIIYKRGKGTTCKISFKVEV